IVGVGLIGGSFGLALRKAGFPGGILGVSSQRSVEQGRERGAIDRGVTLEEAAASADLIFLSQPISGILETLRQLGPMARRDTLVTDAGSTKQVIVDEAKRSLPGRAFLGGHPMAGKELRGAGAADADLFRGRPWVLTEDLDHPVARAFRHWLGLFGAREIVLDPARHDFLVAWGSHLPQLASTALAAALEDHAPGAAEVAGPGLLDMTRLALSSYELWGDILETNTLAIGAALDAYIARLQALRKNFEADFAAGSSFAKSLRAGK
ncbi:MAG: prephenate dehydrogenase/arogenate dehydrogenase family protein, partial [Acidobacteriota bacterium]